MLRTIIHLVGAGGEKILIAPNEASGIAVQSATVTQCVNSGEELTLGSACANALEASLFTPVGGLKLDAGATVAVCKEDDDGVRTDMGIFTLEKPTRPTANMMKITGYDNVSKLDRDMTAWLSEYNLRGGSDTLLGFAKKVCGYCGVNLVNTELAPNGAFSMPKITCSSVTGRQLMQWIGEICCQFCRANPDGSIEFGWYAPSGKEITASGELYYFKNGLSYENYITEEIGAVQVASGSEAAALSDAVNSYVIQGNPILAAMEANDVALAVSGIQRVLSGFRYVPCKVSVPANLSIRAGHMVDIVDKNGRKITTCVMTRTQTGQTDTLESTGSHRRDSTAAVNNQTAQQKTAQIESKADLTLVNAKAYADGVLKKAEEHADRAAATARTNALKDAKQILDRDYIVKKLTNDGELTGIYEKDGKWHIDAELAQIVNLVAECVESKLGEMVLQIKDAALRMVYGELETVKLSSEAGHPCLRLKDQTQDAVAGESVLTAYGIGFGTADDKRVLTVGMDAESGKAFITIRENEAHIKKVIRWKDNGDETFTLIGE